MSIVNERIGMSLYRIKKGILTFSPAYFALAMSTGIIAIASNMLGYTGLARYFFILNNLEFGILTLILIIRLIYCFPAFREDLSSHAEGAGFLTIIASACILGTEYTLLTSDSILSKVLWYFSIIAWVVIVYSFFILVTIRKRKPTLENGINGSWLLFVVSVQALSILGNFVAPSLRASQEASAFINLFFYLLGVLFYLVVIGIIFYRTTFFPMKANEFKPSYWIDMGAAAITTLAGTMLVTHLGTITPFRDFIPTIKVLTVFFWIAGSWWIPAILVLEIWRHLNIGVQYKSGYWCLVFPLGVYTVCTWHLSEVLQLPFLKFVSRVSIYMAWLAWVIIFIGMLKEIVKVFSYRKRRAFNKT